MTIDEHIGVIEDLKSTMSVCMPEPEKTEICTSLGEAIDTMRKYQKLERVFDKTIAEIEQVKSIMNDEIINHNRKDLINFINGLNQSLMIFDKYRRESEE